jgi:hypothetical protein
MTRPPEAASRAAIAAPMPRAPPVTRATRAGSVALVTRYSAAFAGACLPATSSACDRSAMMSSMCSMPMDSRT